MIWLFWSVWSLILSAPFVVFLSCKLGSYGVLLGRRKFRDQFRNVLDTRTMKDYGKKE